MKKRKKMSKTEKKTVLYAMIFTYGMMCVAVLLTIAVIFSADAILSILLLTGVIGLLLTLLPLDSIIEFKLKKGV